MIDITLIRENTDLIKKTCEQKGCSVNIDELLQLDDERRSLLQETEAIKAEKNKANKEIPSLPDDEKKAAIEKLRSFGDKEKELDEKIRTLMEKWTALMLQVPQPTSEDTPVGKDDTENVEMYTVGDIPTFDFEAKDHVELGKALDIVDIPRGVKVAGARNYFLKNEGVELEMAILKYTLDKLIGKGFSPFTPPHVVNYEPMMGTSYFPGGEEQAYAVGVERERGKGVESDNKYLIGTSEVPVAAYHSDEMFKEDDLPKLMVGISPCYRREAGTYGKDTHGLYRIHQFQKVEQVILCKNDAEESKKMHEMILKNAEEVLQDLKLPYRVVSVCTGDIGQGQYYKNDIETWMPSRDSFGETHSCSTFHEFQARRLNIRYKNKDGKTQYVHTLNNTAIASPRILIPVLECYQNEDGSVTIPEVLRPYMRGLTKIEVKSA